MLHGLDPQGKKISFDLQKYQQTKIQYFDDPIAREKDQIPPSSTIEELLVNTSRGDKITLLVDHLQSFVHTLMANTHVSRSVLEVLAPEKNEIKAKVAAMTAKVSGHHIDNKDLGQGDLPNQPNSQVNFANSLVIKDFRRPNYIDKELVINALNRNILGVCTHWLGAKPSIISASQLRWGKKGSLLVNQTGSKTGAWYHHELQEGGHDLISLYMKLFNVSFRDTIKTLAQDLGIEAHEHPAEANFKQGFSINSSNKDKLKQEKIDLDKLKYVKDIYSKAKSIEDTPAEVYLRKVRGIEGKIPEDFRFAKLKHPYLKKILPALIVPIKDKYGDLRGIVRIFMEKDGTKLYRTYTDDFGEKRSAIKKANLGLMYNAAVALNLNENSSIAFVAEGVETALSIVNAKPDQNVFAALSVSNLSKVPLPGNISKIVLCADEDGLRANSNQALLKAAHTFHERGLAVNIAFPKPVTGMTKYDFNDVLIKDGIQGVKESLANTLPYQPSTITEQTIDHEKTKLMQLSASKELEAIQEPSR